MNLPRVSFGRLLPLFALLFAAVSVSAQQPPQLLQELQKLDQFRHAQQVGFSQQRVVDHELGLGALQKISGLWQFKSSVRLSGELTRYTWQILDGFTSEEVMRTLLQRVEQEGAQQMFSCDGRACGSGSIWANRVFGQRVLYGRAEFQRYRVYRQQEGESELRLLVYAAARTAQRQYLHVELLAVDPQ